MSTPTRTAAAIVALACGCGGYAEGSSREADSGAPAPVLPDASVQTAPAHVEPTLAPRRVPVSPPASNPVAMNQAPVVQAPDRTSLRVAHTLQFDGYLTDSAGQPLYMLVDDISGAATTACLGDCARDWPAFDVKVIEASSEIDSAEVSRFHRQDGAWQTTYKGQPLYYRAAEAGTRDVTGDGDSQRWFVARDYLAFLASARTFAPAGGTETNGAFLTDGFGRTLYVCLDDQPRTDAMDAISSCDALCTVKRPVFRTSASERTTLLPSTIDVGALGALVRTDGQLQLTYRGWPLYYDSGDVTPGATEGHNERAWRAIDPIAFGSSEKLGSAD